MKSVFILLSFIFTRKFVISSFLYEHKKFDFFFELDDEIVESIFEPRKENGDILLENIDLYNSCLLYTSRCV